MLTENLMILRVAATVPSEFSVFDPKLRFTALTSAFHYAAIESAHPCLDVRRVVFSERNPTPVMDCLAVTNVRWPCHVIDESFR